MGNVVRFDPGAAPPRVLLVRLAHGHALPVPSYATEGAAGLDLASAIPGGETWVLAPGERRLVPTGFSIAIEAGWEGQIRPRSGLALRDGVTVLNAPGTIDCDYRGEVMVLLVNHGGEAAMIARGQRIAQLVVAPVARARVRLFDTLAQTARGVGGFGSTDGITNGPIVSRSSDGRSLEVTASKDCIDKLRSAILDTASKDCIDKLRSAILGIEHRNRDIHNGGTHDAGGDGRA